VMGGRGWGGEIWEREGRENLEEREKMKRNPKLKSTWFGFLFLFFWLNVDELRMGLLLRSIILNYTNSLLHFKLWRGKIV
jgi:hypothetical protein